jgi:hypothetical protein
VTIAAFLEIPVESVLVSPLRRLPPAEERQVAEQLAAAAHRLLEGRRSVVAPARVDLRLHAIARRLGALPAKDQRQILALMRTYERIHRKQTTNDAAARRRRTPPPSQRRNATS